MLTFRAIPPGRAEQANELLRLYRGELLARWSPPERWLALLLGRAGLGVGWSRAEATFLSEEIRDAGLSMAERKGVHRILNPGAFPLAANSLKNKALFAEHAAGHGLAVPATYDPAVGPLGRWLESRDAVIVKRNYSSKGKGIEAFTREAGGWRGGAGEQLAGLDLERRLRRSLARGAVVQERLSPHPGLVDLSPTALPTLRVMTCRDEAGEPEECGVILRLSAGGPTPVDNFNAGNLAARIDEAGRCGTALHRRGDAAVPVTAHPATRAAIAGRPVPDLTAAVELSLRAHRTLGEGFTVVGWDVGLAENGPVLVEGNWNPGTVIPQLVLGVGVDATRLGELYRHHLRAAPPERWAASRVVHWDRRPR